MKSLHSRKRNISQLVWRIKILTRHLEISFINIECIFDTYFYSSAFNFIYSKIDINSKWWRGRFGMLTAFFGANSVARLCSLQFPISGGKGHLCHFFLTDFPLKFMCSNPPYLFFLSCWPLFLHVPKLWVLTVLVEIYNYLHLIFLLYIAPSCFFLGFGHLAYPYGRTGRHVRVKVLIFKEYKGFTPLNFHIHSHSLIFTLIVVLQTNQWRLREST